MSTLRVRQIAPMHIQTTVPTFYHLLSLFLFFLIFSFFFYIFCLFPCSTLSWLSVSFLLHVKYTLCVVSYRISYVSSGTLCSAGKRRQRAIYDHDYIYSSKSRRKWTPPGGRHQFPGCVVNALMRSGNYIATSNNIKLVHWALMGGLLHLVQRGGDWAGPQPAQAPPRCAKCNSNGQCTNHRTAV